MYSILLVFTMAVKYASYSAYSVDKSSAQKEQNEQSTDVKKVKHRDSEEKLKALINPQFSLTKA